MMWDIIISIAAASLGALLGAAFITKRAALALVLPLGRVAGHRAALMRAAADGDLSAAVDALTSWAIAEKIK